MAKLNSKEGDLFDQFLNGNHDQKEYKQMIKDSEKKYAPIYESIPLAIVLVDMTGMIVYSNSQVENLYGYNREEYVGKRFTNFELFSDNDKRIVYKALKTLLEGEKPGPKEVQLYSKNGQQIWIELHASLVKFQEKTLFQVISRDINDRKKAEQELIESEKKYRNIINNLSDIIGELDLKGNITYLSPQIFNILGYEPEEIIGNQIFNYIHPEDVSLISENIKNAIIYDKDFSVEFRAIHKNKSSIPISLRGSLITFKDSQRLVGVLRDISDKKEAEIKIKESEEKYRNIVNNITDIILETNSKGIVTYVSPQCFSIMGYSPEELIGKLAIKYIHPEDLLKIANVMREAPNYQKLMSLEYRLIHKDGRYIPISARGRQVNFNGETRMIAAITDITTQKESEIKLKESEEKYRNIINNITDIILEVDSKGIITYVSPQCFDIMGYLPEELIGKLSFKHVHPEDLQKVAVRMRKALNSKELMSLEYRLIHKNGKIIPVSARGRQVKINGEFRIIGAFTNITAQKEVEQKLLESEKNFRNITEQSLMGIVIVQDGQFKYANDAALNIIEYTIEEILEWPKNRFYIKLIHPEDLLRVENSRTNISYRIITKLGRIKWIDHYTQRIKYQGKEATLLTFIDVSDKKEAEELIKEENERLLELNKIRRDLIMRASHELKTPLISVYGASQMLLKLYKDQVSSKAYEFVELIHKGGQRLKVLVDNLLDASRIESGMLKLNLQEENLVGLLRECIDDVKYLVDQKDLSLSLESPDQYSLIVDKIRIEQVITNLLSNAIKNTPTNGEINIFFVENKNWVDISIKDTGIGLTKNEKKLLFKRFGKIERNVKESDIDIEGSGLGLVISKEIAELHGGKILVESKGRNKGSKFTLRLFKKNS